MVRDMSIAAAMFGLAGCATLGTRPDPLCQHLREFAASVPAGETRAISLRGGWGGDSQQTLMTHSCEHGNYPPGKSFCEYLVPNTSWEFGQYNARRAVMCVESSDKKPFIESLDELQGPAELRGTLAGAGIEAPMVLLRYEPTEISKLTISVAGGER